jgi:hypothetical protein
VPKIGFSDEVRLILSRASEEAEKLASDRVEVAHLLLAVLAVSQQLRQIAESH